MTSPIEALLDLEAEIQADIDAIAEERSDTYRDLFADLLVGVENRDSSIFEWFGIPVAVVIADLADVPIPDRDAEWHRHFAAMWGAAKWQAWMEVFGLDFLAEAEKNGQAVQALAEKMPRGDLKAAAVQGIGKDRMKAKADARRLRDDQG